RCAGTGGPAASSPVSTLRGWAAAGGGPPPAKGGHTGRPLGAADRDRSIESGINAQVGGTAPGSGLLQVFGAVLGEHLLQGRGQPGGLLKIGVGDGQRA